MKNSESLPQVLDLRMKPLFLISVENNLSHQNDSVDQIKTLMSQDHSYYRNSVSAMNAADREKMAQWEYRIVDHFSLSRDLVGIAFSILDRFTAKRECDRRAYKLATMTSLYIAVKIHHPRRFSTGTLATLSRGEFNTSHIAQMELIMLRALDWRLSPPTVQSFIYIWGNYLFKGPHAMESIERARFLAEIAVFDTLLSSKERTLLAIAAMTNSIEGKFGPFEQEQMEVTMLRKLKTDFGVNYAQQEVQGIRNRLRYIYSKTSQCLAEFSNQLDVSMVPYNRNKMEHEETASSCRNTIKMKYFQSPRSVRTRCEHG